MNPFEMIEGRDYDCKGASIQCRADREGATVFEIHSGNVVVNALAHTIAEATEAAEAYAAMELDGNP